MRNQVSSFNWHSLCVVPANAQSTFLTNHQIAGTALKQKYIVMRAAHLAFERAPAMFHPLKTPDMQAFT